MTSPRPRWTAVTPVALALTLMVLAPSAPAATAQTRRVPVEGGSYTSVSAAALGGMLARKDFLLVNVHVPYAGEIAGTDLFVPFDTVAASRARLPRDTRARIVVYCRSGAMSAVAARQLVALGYTDVWDLDGGMVAWQQAGLPLTRRR